MVSRSEPTPADRVSARAVEEARREALSSLWGYTRISNRMLRTLIGSVVVSLAMNLAVWVYVLIQLPP